MPSLLELARFSGLVTFVVGLPATIGTLIQVLRTRREAREAREGLVFSQNCLEFVTESGQVVNVVPLETLHSLPKPGDVVLLPGGADLEVLYQAYRVRRVEFVYSRVKKRRDGKETLPGQALLAKAVVYVDPVAGAALEPDASAQQ